MVIMHINGQLNWVTINLWVLLAPTYRLKHLERTRRSSQIFFTVLLRIHGEGGVCSSDPQGHPALHWVANYGNEFRDSLSQHKSMV